MLYMIPYIYLGTSPAVTVRYILTYSTTLTSEYNSFSTKFSIDKRRCVRVISKSLNGWVYKIGTNSN